MLVFAEVYEAEFGFDAEGFVRADAWLRWGHLLTPIHAPVSSPTFPATIDAASKIKIST